MTNGQFPVPQETVEAGLLASVNQNMERWLEVNSFSSEDFIAHREVFQFFGTYLTQYGNLPSQSQLNTRFTWQPPIGDFAYWLAEMKRYALARHVMEIMTEGYAKISEPNEALTLLVDKLSLVRSQQTNHIKAWDSGALDRLAKFDYRTEAIFNTHELIGMRTGMKVIDNTQIGWIPGSMVGAFARPGVGKTWWLLWQGIMAWQDGYTVLAVTPEMPANWLDQRVDVLAGAVLGYPIEYNQLLVGDPAIRDSYQAITSALAQSQRWWTYDSFNDHAVSLGDLAALIRQHQPDEVLVDGVSLLRATNRGQTWEQMRELCYGIKNLATIHEVPIIVTHQASNIARGRRSEEELMPTLNDSAYGDAFVAACSDVIILTTERTTPYVRWYTIPKHRERGWRQALPARMGMICDFGTGRIQDVGDLGWSPEAVGQEARRILGR